jgi:hypothetical protein
MSADNTDKSEMPRVRSSKFKSFVMVAAVTFCAGLSLGPVKGLAQGAPAPVQHSIKREAWQNRRLERLKLIKDALAPNVANSQAFDQMLTNFEAHPVAQTPIENMDLLGLFYARREGIAKALPVIVMNATLGWYDALRFGSPSGQIEIVNKAMLFKHVFVLAGKERINEYMEFAKSHPAEIQAAIDQGLVFAEKFKNSGDYDRRWPTAYGLERMICALGEACPPAVEAPQSQWNALWDQAKLRVKTYYK